MVDVSIVITNFNSKEYIIKCIASIRSSINRYSYEIVVVDDASTDGSAEEIRSKYPDINVIQNRSNSGYIISNNAGIRMSTGKYILSLNNDTVVLDGAIDSLLEFMDTHPEAGAVGPRLLNEDGSVQMQCRRGFPTPLKSLLYFSGLHKLFPKSRLFGGYLLSYLDDTQTAEVDSLCGAAMLVRREVINKVGLMDESYFMYGDDIDWCYRIKNAGWKVVYFPGAEILHYGGRGGSRHQSFRNIIIFHRAMAVFHKKHYAKNSLFILNWLVYCGIWLKCTVELTKNLFRKDKFVGTKKP